MFYGLVVGYDVLFFLGLEYNEGDEWNLLGVGGQGRVIFGGYRFIGGDVYCFQ